MASIEKILLRCILSVGILLIFLLLADKYTFISHRNSKSLPLLRFVAEPPSEPVFPDSSSTLSPWKADPASESTVSVPLPWEPDSEPEPSDAHMGPVSIHGPFRYDPPSSVPCFYHRILVPGSQSDIYGFLDADGHAQFRIYGSSSEYRNGFVSDSNTGWWSVQLSRHLDKFEVLLDGNTVPCSDQETNAAKPSLSFPKPGKVKDVYIRSDSTRPVFSMTMPDGSVRYRAYARTKTTEGLFPCDYSGNISAGSFPIDQECECMPSPTPEQSSVSIDYSLYPALIAPGFVLSVYE